ncbi:beta-phosphoglucomutase [Planomicrobium sp. CPCC 101110]|uniref:beta-phosphoglucomutase n=1 Tax=Planomicrobium sp. CPCC 101110 TaxID=2599619 RepID=UPI0011B77963|nr:beta-phosphoglucomutase [Planomicrobium sp. CPCC 101110]TWT27275.1 beta-phosphoglucomutase [Planomicrobium sp. CPCC 101110]
MKKLDAVVFDLDGVITDTAHFHFLAWKKLAEELGIPFDEAFNEKLKGISRMDSLDLILHNGNQQDRFTDQEKEEMADRKNRHYQELLKKLGPDDILPGILELIAEIKGEGLPIAIASVSKNAQTVLEALDLETAFDYVVDAATVRNSKPDPEIFLTACEKLGALPEHSIGIEDALAGIAAIKAGGMFAVGVGPALDGADYRVDTTAELDWGRIKKAYENFSPGL